MTSKDFTDKLKATRSVSQSAAPKGAADTFTSSRPTKEPTAKTTVNIPVSVHEKMRTEAFETGVSMTDQLINAWKAQRGFD